MGETRKISMTVNGKSYQAEAEVRLTLADFLRHTLGPHRHASRLRARRLRRLHDPA